MDALPVVGTTVALRFIKEKFQADELAVPELTQTLLVALHMATANPDAIHLTSVSGGLTSYHAVQVFVSKRTLYRYYKIFQYFPHQTESGF